MILCNVEYSFKSQLLIVIFTHEQTDHHGIHLLTFQYNLSHENQTKQNGWGTANNMRETPTNKVEKYQKKMTRKLTKGQKNHKTVKYKKSTREYAKYKKSTREYAKYKKIIR